jgi:exosortase
MQRVGEMNLKASAEDRSGLSRIALMIPVFALVLAIYGGTLVGLFHELLDSSDQSQGLAIVPFAILIAWLRRNSVQTIPASLDLRGLLLAGAGCALHVFGKHFAGSFASEMSFIFVLSGMIWTFWGAGRLRALALPLLLLFVAIPLPSFMYARLSMPLQQLSSQVACSIADRLGVVIYREGNILHLASMTVGVWEACSGLNSLFALMAGAILMGFALCRLPLARALVWIAAIPIAVIANVARVTGTAILSDWHPAYAMGFYHLFSGWLVFVVGAICLYFTSICLRRLID